MEYRWIGRSGVRVSELCLGTMTFGHGADEAQSARMVGLALDSGINFFDTANAYAGGTSEEFLGRALKGKRDKVILATKFTNPMGPGPNDSGSSRVHILRAVEDSLRRLGTDYVDLYYAHHVDSYTPLEEMLRALDDLIRQGKVRYVACSNYPAWRLCDALWISETRNLDRFICYQASYSLVVRELEQELIPLCHAKGLGVLAYSSLAGGFLSGKYKPGQRSIAGTRSEEGWVFHNRFFTPNADDTLKALIEAAESHDCSPAQAAIRWVLEQPGVSSALVGARTIKQLEDNIKAADVRLDAETLNRLTEISALPARYPYALEKGVEQRRLSALKMTSAT